VSCDCDVFGDEFRVDHLALESPPAAFSLLTQRAPELYQCTQCERWYRVQHWVVQEVQFREDSTYIKRLTPDEVRAVRD
jgi:hypothetical protein